MDGYISPVKKDDCYNVFYDIFADGDYPDDPYFKRGHYYLANKDDDEKQLNIKENWDLLNYRGVVVTRPSNAAKNDLIVYSDLVYYIYNGSEWEEFSSAIYMITQFLKEKRNDNE